MRLRCLGVIGLLALAPLMEAPCQASETANLTTRFGLTAAINSATLAGSDVQGASNRTGLAVGGLLVFPIGHNFALQPEVQFAMKGVEANSSTVNSAAKLDYVELPVLVRYDIPASGGVKPFTYAGPALSLRTSCNLEGTSQGTTVSISCDDFVREFGSGTVTFSTVDVGGILGGGLAFDVGGKVLTIGVQYELGFVSIVSTSDTKNRVLSFVGTFEWPFHR